MDIDIKCLSFQELQSLLDSVMAEMKSRISEDEQELISRKEYIANILTAQTQTSQKKPHGLLGKTIPPMYQSKDGKNTWSGRGLPPKWMVDHVKAGGKREDLLINQTKNDEQPT